MKNKIDYVIKNSAPRKPVNKGVIANRNIPFPNGRDSLYSYLESKTEEFFKKIVRPIVLIVNCQIDSEGNTIKVTIRNRDKTPTDDNVKELVSRLSEIFMDEIEWIPDRERFPFDVVSIPLRFMVVDEKTR